MPTQNVLPPAMAQNNMLSLEFCRQKRGLTRGQLSEFTGISRATIAQYESAPCRFSQSNYNKLAEVFCWQKWKD